jgi:putative ATP-binding cassette transporter
MQLLWLLLRTSWLNVAIAGLAGTLGGICNAALIASINSALEASSDDLNRLVPQFLGLMVVALATSLVSQFLLAGLSYEAIYKLRLQLSRWILACPLQHLEAQGTNRILATLTEDINAIADTIATIPFLWIDVSIVISCLVYLCWRSGIVFLLTVSLLLAAIYGMQLLLARSYRLMERAREEEDRLFKHFRAITDGIKELKLNAQRRQAFLTQNLQATAMRSRQYDVTSIRILGVSASLGELLFFTIVGIVVFILPRFVSVNATILSTYILVITYLTDPLQRILEILPGLSRGSVALQKISSLGLSLASRTEFMPPHVKPLPFKGQIELINLTYTYQLESTENFTLGPINLVIHPGELVFIVGGNGSGKSTFGKLLSGLYLPTSGEIQLDGRSISERNREAYRQLFATVYSDFYLFEEFLDIDSKDIEARAQKYLRKLGLEDKVEILQDELSPNGSHRLSTLELSQGQRKRLALLTAYLEDRPIYLFDEWAADQDPTFREFFYRQLLPEFKHQRKTVLAITHDDRYFNLSDRLIKLDYGQVMDIS